MRKTKEEFDNEIKTVANANNYEVLDIFMNGTNRRISYFCKKHPDIIQESYFVRFKKGIKCPYCFREEEYNVIQQEFFNAGYELLSNVNDYDKTNLLYRCMNHPKEIQHTTWYNFKKGHGCRYCGYKKLSEALKNDFELVKQEFSERGYELLENNYVSSTTKMKYRCLQHPDRDLFMSYNDLMHGVSCPFCVGAGTSFPEQFIYYYIKKYYTDAINRKKLFGYEYDIIIPSLKLLIEYDGQWYHKNNSRDHNKEVAAADNQWKFIRIKETNDQLLKRSPVVNNNLITIFGQYGRHIDYMNKLIDVIFEYINATFNMSIQCIKEENIYTIVLNNCNKIQESNSLTNTHPHIADEWDYEKNWPLTPDMFSKGSSYKPFWKCAKCGFSWDAVIANRTCLGRGCPSCNGGVSKSVDQFDLDGMYLKTFSSCGEAGRAMGVTSGAIYNACKNKSKTCCGFLWRYHINE